MITILLFVGLVLIPVMTARAVSLVQFRRAVTALFAQSENISARTFSFSQLQGLPEPVQRYFKHVLKEGQPYISYVRLRHNGQFKTDLKKAWVHIEGEQYFTTEKPGFIWKGTTPMFTAQDRYILNKGRLTVSLFSLFKIADGQGEKYDQGELLRWLGESVWFPTNLLPSRNLHWAPINHQSAQLTFNHHNFSLSYEVIFNDIGEIMQFETKRYMGEAKLETWVGKLSQYKELNGVVVPTTLEAIYRLEEGDYSYARFTVKAIEYDRPEKF